jgi:hypothetical protein
VLSHCVFEGGGSGCTPAGLQIGPKVGGVTLAANTFRGHRTDVLTLSQL